MTPRRTLSAILLAGLILGSTTCGHSPVEVAPVAAVVIQPDSSSLTVGETGQLTASVRGADNTVLTDRTLTWASLDPAKATVSASGLVTAISAGRVVITATSEGVKGEGVVQVIPVPVAQVVVTPDSTTLALGDTVRLTASPRAASGALLAGREITWTSDDPTIVSVSSIGLARALSTGRALLTATSEGMTGTAVIVVVVSDVAIVDAQFTQAIQAGDGTIPIVLGGNAAVVNVLLRATTKVRTPTPIVLRLYDSLGTLVRTDTAEAPSVPTTAPDYAAPSVQFLVPAGALEAGLQWEVVRDPEGRIPDDSSGNDVFPRAGPAALATIAVPELRVRFVPIVLSSHNNTTGQISDATMPEYVRVTKSVHPLGAFTTTIGAPLTTAASFGTPPSGGDAPFWQQVLAELDLARVTDVSDPETTYWFGVVRPPPDFTYTLYGGFGYIPSSGYLTGTGTRTALAVQVGWFSNSTQSSHLVAHELGHNFGRYHAPCGGAASPDPYFPNAGGVIGAPGHNVFAWANGQASSAMTIGAQTGDIMGYCLPAWSSVYTYTGVMAFRGPLTAAPPVRVAQATRVLVLRGAVTASGVSLEPAFVLRGRATTTDGFGGPYTVEGRAGDGRLLFRHDFTPATLDHAPDVHPYLLAIPVAPDVEDELDAVEVRGPAGSASMARPAAAGIAAGRVASPTAERRGRMVRVACADPTARAIIVLDGASGRMLGTARGASATVTAGPGTSLDLLCSDGIRTAHAALGAR